MLQAEIYGFGEMIMEKAFIVIDMQQLYLGKKGYDEGLAGRINERIHQAEKREELIIYVKNSGRFKGQPYISDFAKELFIASSYIFVKSEMSAFSAPAFVDFLVERQVTEITLAGIDGNCCVASTALSAVDNGMKVVFPRLLIGARSKKQFEKTVQKLTAAGVIVE